MTNDINLTPFGRSVEAAVKTAISATALAPETIDRLTTRTAQVAVTAADRGSSPTRVDEAVELLANKFDDVAIEATPSAVTLTSEKRWRCKEAARIFGRSQRSAR